jgi:acyl-CoA oxidase
MNFFGMIRFFGQQATTMITELNPITTRSRDEGHLRDPEFSLAAFRYREEHIVMGAAKRLQKRIKGGMDAYDAFIEVQNHLMSMAHAYMDRVVLEYFVEAVRQAPASLQPALGRVCQLFALHRIEENKAWYLEYGYIEAPKSKAISMLVDKLCGEIRQDALALVDAFDIPDQCLAAPIVG